MLDVTTRTPLQRRWSGGIAAITVATGLFLSACTGGTSQNPGTTGGESSESSPNGGTTDLGELSIQLSWVKNAEFVGEYMADDHGYFDDAGFSSVNLIAGPAPTVGIVAAGQALVGISDPTRVAPAIANEGAPVKIIANQYQSSPFSILSLADGANIAKPADLVGKRIGVQTGNEPLFYALLDTNGLDRDAATIVPVEYDPSPLTTGEVDGFLAYVTNESIILESKGYEVVNLLYNDHGLPLVAHSLVVSAESIRSKRNALKAFLYGSILGWKDAIADSDEAARLAVEVYGANLDLKFDLERRQAKVVSEELVVNVDTKSRGLFTITDERAADVVRLLNKTGIVITQDELFDFSLLEEVYAEHPELLE